MPDLGQSFSPADQSQGGVDPNLRRRRTPVQQALQTLSLQLPAYTGGNAVASDLLSGRTGGVVRQAAGVPRTQALLNAMMAGGATGGGGTGQGRAVRYGGGFGGGGFGDAGGGTTVSGGGGRPGAGARPSLPGLSLPGGATLPGKIGGGLQGLLPGGKPPRMPGKLPGVPPLPPSLKPPRQFMPAPPNPNVVGGGHLDALLPPPPRVNFGRPADEVRFNTPIAPVAPPAAPVPPPPVVVPIGAAGPNGNVYTGPPASGPPAGYGPPVGSVSTAPSQYGGGGFRYPTSFNPYGNY